MRIYHLADCKVQTLQDLQKRRESCNDTCFMWCLHLSERRAYALRISGKCILNLRITGMADDKSESRAGSDCVCAVLAVSHEIHLISDEDMKKGQLQQLSFL